MQTPNVSTESSPPSNDGEVNLLLAVGYFLAEHGYNANFADGTFTLTIPNRVTTSDREPLLFVAHILDSHNFYWSIHHPFNSYVKCGTIDLCEPDSFDKILEIVKCA